MNEKKIFLKLLKYMGIFFVGGVVALAGFVWLVDPFYHYHAPVGNIPIVLDTAVYQTAGAAKNLTYDSAIVGTSMTENFHTSWFDEGMGWDTMKLSYSGARSSDLEAIFGEISEREQPVENIVMDINEYQLTVPEWTRFAEHPEYLYDEKIWNDYSYLLNHDVIVRCAERCLDALLGVKDNVDVAYTWEEPELFGKQFVVKDYGEQREQLIAGRIEMGDPFQVSGIVSDNIQEKYQVCQENLNNILPFIENNANTNFHVMFPPYSIAYWEQKILSGELENMIAVYAYTIDKLLQYENVQIYYFQDERDIIVNLDNYRDVCHHTPEINRYMFECIRDGKNVLTKDNYKEAMKDMYEFAATYPYEQLWIE